MSEIENLAMENVAENVDTTTEEVVEQKVEQIETPAKSYTEEEVNQIVGKRLARQQAKIRKEYDKKYGELESVLRAGTGKEDVAEMADTFRDYYTKRGVQIPTAPAYSDRDIEVLAKAEAEDIIGSGFEEVVEEVDRLAKLGAENMSQRDKALFRQLAEYRQKTERSNELAKIGVTEDVYGSKEFTEFAAKFSPSTPITEVYQYYSKMQPKKEVQTMGSMKSSTSENTGVKDFYTPEEARKFTKKDLDNNPALFKAIEKSMQKW